jgi:hypothetical protein
MLAAWKNRRLSAGAALLDQRVAFYREPSVDFDRNRIAGTAIRDAGCPLPKFIERRLYKS